MAQIKIKMISTYTLEGTNMYRHFFNEAVCLGEVKGKFENKGLDVNSNVIQLIEQEKYLE